MKYPPVSVSVRRPPVTSRAPSWTPLETYDATRSSWTARNRDTGSYSIDDLVVDRALHEQPRAGDAHLAGVPEDREADGVDGEVEVGCVGEDDVRGLAPRLGGDPLHVRLGGISQEPLADLGRARERNGVDSVVEAEGSPCGLAVPGHDVEHTRGNPRFESERTDAKGGER